MDALLAIWRQIDVTCLTVRVYKATVRRLHTQRSFLVLHSLLCIMHVELGKHLRITVLMS